MSTDVEVLEAGVRTLRELADEANREHDMCEQHLLSALPHAIRAGHALLEAHGQVEHGVWEDWLEREFHGSTVLARLYVRLAYYEDHTNRFRSIKDAREAIKHLPPICLPGARQTKYDEATRQQALALLKQGMTQRQICSLLGVGRGTIYLWVHPERAKARSRRQSQHRRKLREREREDRIKRAVRKAGAATQEAWAMAERMQDVIAQAHRETGDREAREALSRAGTHYRKMRDEIVRALGVQ